MITASRALRFFLPLFTICISLNGWAKSTNPKFGYGEFGLGATSTELNYDSNSEFSGPTAFLSAGIGKTVFFNVGASYAIRSEGDLQITAEDLNVYKLKSYWLGIGVNLSPVILTANFAFGGSEREYQAAGQTGSDYTEDTTDMMTGYRATATVSIFSWGKDNSFGLSAHYLKMDGKIINRKLEDGTNTPSTEVKCSCDLESVSGFLTVTKGF